MIYKLIEEINLALDNNLYIIALNTALTLPDICGKAEYPELKTAERYKKWYQEYIGQYEQSNSVKGTFPYLKDDLVYNLRCNLLHQGTPNAKSELINEFIVTFAKNGIDRSSITNEKATYTVNARRLCEILMSTAKNYYDNNKDKFNFFNYTIIDEKNNVIIGKNNL